MPLVTTKGPAETVELVHDWTPTLGTATIVQSNWTVPAPLSLVGQEVVGGTVIVRITGGALGAHYTVINSVTLSDNRVQQQPFTVLISSAGVMEYLTPAFVRDQYLRGMPMENSLGQPLTDGLIADRIRSAVALFERRYAVRLTPTAVKVGPNAVDGEVRIGDELEPGFIADRIERHAGVDYHRDQMMDNRHFIMKLPIAPIRRVVSLGLWMPGMQQAARFPSDWAYTERRSFRLRVYPGRNLTFQVLFTGTYYANLVPAGRPIPEAWTVSYVGGYSPLELGTTDFDVVQAVGKMAACEILVPGSIDANLARGIQSKGVGVDGLSQNINLIHNPQAVKYQPLILAYREELKQWESTFFARQSGVRLGII